MRYAENTTVSPEKSRAEIGTCKWGHQFDASNTYQWKRPNGRIKRVCRLCQKDRQRKYKAARLPTPRHELPSTECDPLMLAWVAGLFEGEGTITISSGGRHGYTVLIVCLSMTDYEPPELLHKIWGGGLRCIRGKKINHNQSWTWRASSATAERFIKEIRPFLKSRRVIQKAELALEYCTQRKQGSRKDGYREARWAFKRRMAELNARGRLPQIAQSYESGKMPPLLLSQGVGR